MEIADQAMPVEEFPEEGVSDPAGVPIPEEDESLTAKRRWLLDEVPTTIKKTRLMEVPQGADKLSQLTALLIVAGQGRSDRRLVAGKR